MNSWRKVRAGAMLALVSGLFWGAAAALVGLGARLIASSWLGVSGLMVRLFGIGAAIGIAGGVVYVTAIALTPPRDDRTGLSGLRSAFFGGLGGMLVFLGLRLTLLASMSGSLISSIVVPGVVFGLCGAATGMGIVNAANRGRLPVAPPPPKVLAP